MVNDTLFELELPDTTSTHSTICRCPSCKAHRPQATTPQQAALDAKSEWHGRARAYVKSLPSRTLITSEDITDVIGLPAGTVASNRNNAVGALMRSLAQADLISKYDYVTSKNPQAHGAVIVLWMVI